MLSDHVLKECHCNETKCNICCGGLAVCSVCGKGEVDLEGPCFTPKERILAWAGEHMLDAEPRSYPVSYLWEKVWVPGVPHTLFKLRLLENDTGVWVIVMSCPGGYGAQESHWRSCPFGHSESLEEIQELYAWMDKKYINKEGG